MKTAGAILALLLVTGCAGDKPQPTESAEKPGPTDAAASRWVIVEFEVDTEGATRNIQIVESHPPGVFDSATIIEAIAKWRYKPALRDGTPVPAKQRIKLRFVPKNDKTGKITDQ